MFDLTAFTRALQFFGTNSALLQHVAGVACQSSIQDAWLSAEKYLTTPSFQQVISKTGFDFPVTIWFPGEPYYRGLVLRSMMIELLDQHNVPLKSNLFEFLKNTGLTLDSSFIGQPDNNTKVPTLGSALKRRKSPPLLYRDLALQATTLNPKAAERLSRASALDPVADVFQARTELTSLAQTPMMQQLKVLNSIGAVSVLDEMRTIAPSLMKLIEFIVYNKEVPHLAIIPALARAVNKAALDLTFPERYRLLKERCNRARRIRLCRGWPGSTGAGAAYCQFDHPTDPPPAIGQG